MVIIIKNLVDSAGLYYGLVFTSLMRDERPNIIMPSQKTGISQNIKA
jgi:hypothetical protein